VSGYENAASTHLLATSCACCGRALRDPESVEAGVGPDCRARHGYDVASGVPDFARVAAIFEHLPPAWVTEGMRRALELADARALASALVHRVALEQRGRGVADLVEAIAACGYSRMAETVALRIAGGRRHAIVVRDEERVLLARVPYSPAFNAQLSSSRVGARYDGDRGCWVVPRDNLARRALWAALCLAFPGHLVVGTSGVRRTPFRSGAAA